MIVTDIDSARLIAEMAWVDSWTRNDKTPTVAQVSDLHTRVSQRVIKAVLLFVSRNARPSFLLKKMLGILYTETLYMLAGSLDVVRMHVQQQS